MNLNNSEEDGLPSGGLDESESPRKRMRLNVSPRKGWSLMDRNTDHEVLQEMGVSMLEQDEGEFHSETPGISSHHKPMKRKHDIENVNPNIKSCVTSPRLKYSPKSPRTKVNPSPGPSRVRSPRSNEKCKPLQPSDLADTTISEEYLIEEETPLAQSVSAQYIPPALTGSKRNRPGLTPLGMEEELVISRRVKSEPSGADSFANLSDEVMLGVFRWLPKRTLQHCMLVCKRWLRVASDETLWQRLNLGNKVLAKNAVGRLLAKKPVIVRLANSEISEWHPPGPPVPSRIQYLDLSMVTIDIVTLDCLIERCPALKKLSLESVAVEDSTCEMIGKCNNLETLNVTMAQGITAEGLECLLQGCMNLNSLNISWCNLSEAALEVLVTMLPQRLQRLNIAGARILTDEMVITLVDRCPRLLELDLSDCSKLSVPAVQAVLTLNRLEHLALSRCYLLPPHVLTKVSSMPSLQYLEVWGMLQTSSLNALRSALPAIHVNKFMFSAIARPTVGPRRTSIWGLRTRD